MKPLALITCGKPRKVVFYQPVIPPHPQALCVRVSRMNFSCGASSDCLRLWQEFPNSSDLLTADGNTLKICWSKEFNVLFSAFYNIRYGRWTEMVPRNVRNNKFENKTVVTNQPRTVLLNFNICRKSIGYFPKIAISKFRQRRWQPRRTSQWWFRSSQILKSIITNKNDTFLVRW